MSATVSIENFIQSARDYCFFIESYQPDNKQDFLEKTRTHLLNLYSKGIEFTFLECTSNEDFKTDSKKENREKIISLISARVEFNYYWINLDPHVTDKDASNGLGDLTDDLADIYFDLKENLLIYNIGTKEAMAHAILILKTLFYHWGTHCIDALWAIHHYLSS